MRIFCKKAVKLLQCSFIGLWRPLAHRTVTPAYWYSFDECVSSIKLFY